jgi:hypothetical protein
MKTADSILILAAATTAILAACADDPVWNPDPVVLDRQLGSTVALALPQQIRDPQAALYPAAEPPKELDGPLGSRILREYRAPTQQQRNQIQSFSIFQQLPGLTGSGAGGSGGGGASGGTGG